MRQCDRPVVRWLRSTATCLPELLMAGMTLRAFVGISFLFVVQTSERALAGEPAHEPAPDTPVVNPPEEHSEPTTNPVEVSDEVPPNPGKWSDPEVEAFLRSQGLDPNSPLARLDKPSFEAGGFANINVSAASDDKGVDFLVGQLVIHGLADLTHGVGAFFETSFNSTPSWEVRVERLLLFWEVNEHFKLTLGRFHIPATWWNSNFHHGLWLQTTARRPLMIGYNDAFIANHAVGLMMEGAVPGADGLGLRYHLAVSGGGDDHKHSGETAMHAHDDRRLAWTAAVTVEPRAMPNFKLGAVAFADPYRQRDGQRVNELAIGAHLAYTSDSPEFIAEYVLVRHDVPNLDDVFYSHGAYAQLAWRLSGDASAWKPYLRYELMHIDDLDPTLASTVSQQLVLAGVRFDATRWCALKVEGVWRQPDYNESIWSGIFQAAVAW